MINFHDGTALVQQFCQQAPHVLLRCARVQDKATEGALSQATVRKAQ